MVADIDLIISSAENLLLRTNKVRTCLITFDYGFVIAKQYFFRFRKIFGRYPVTDGVENSLVVALGD